MEDYSPDDLQKLLDWSYIESEDWKEFGKMAKKGKL